MEEVLISFATEKILKKLVSIAAEEIGIAWGLTGDLNNLKESLEMIQAVLQDAEKRQVREEAVRLWLKKLKDIALDADDVIDEFEYEILRRKACNFKSKVCDFFLPSNPIAFRFKIATKVKKVNMSLDRVKAEVAGFGLRVGPIETIPQINIGRMTHSFLADTKVVGRKNDESEIVALLTTVSNCVEPISVVPIVGVAGVGKTTLAQLVYSNARVKSHFDVRMWVCVSETFDVLRILREMHESLTRNKVGLDNMDTLILCLREALQEKEDQEAKRFLLVLDDVWNTDSQEWDRLRNCLLGIAACEGNCVMTTTRSNQVASIMETHPRHQLGILSEEECWCIFKGRALENEETLRDPDLEAIGQKIVKKCGGVPLVARVLGGTLQNKKEKHVWLSIQNSEIWNLEDDNVNKMLGIVKLSYDYLPSSSLKKCFAYCSIFPKDFVLEKDMLIQLWMALGFLQPFKSNMVAKDIGDLYFDILLANSLFQDVKADEYGNIISCKMHDIVHDLVLSISKSEVLSLRDDFKGDISSTQHLVWNWESTKIKFPKKGFGKMRGLFYVGFFNMRSDFKYLRVLKCEFYSKEQESIGKLKHLRYLEIKSLGSTLFDSITKLYHLQTLRLECCNYLRKLPRNLGALDSLQHIYVKNWDKLSPNCFKKFPFLILGDKEGYRIEEWGVHKIDKFKGELKINKLEWLDKGCAKRVNLWKNTNIKKLSYRWRENRDGSDDDADVLDNLLPPQDLEVLAIENFGGEKFPSWVMSMKVNNLVLLEKLKELKLIGCEKCEEIPVLANLPCLIALEFNGMENMKRLGAEFYGKIGGGNGRVLFPALESFMLKRMASLVEWVEAPQHSGDGGRGYGAVHVFPHLRILKIEECPLLTSIPVRRFPLNILDHVNCGSTTCEFEYRTTHYSFDELSWKLNEESLLKTHGLSSIKEFSIFECDRVSKFPPSWLKSCTSLEKLAISSCCNLDSLTEDMGELNSLVDLSISYNNRLTFFDESIGRLTCLKRLTIGAFSEELEDFPGLSCIQHLSASLEYLQMIGWEQLKSLPDQLQHFKALKELDIYNFYAVEALPEWLGNLSSLKELCIASCNNLKHLPSEEAIRCLSELKGVWTLNCPYLEGMCAHGNNNRWSKILNILRVPIQEATI